MAWTYDLSQLGTSQLFQVRRLIGDVISNDQQISDEEINFALTVRSNIYGAASDCCNYIAAQYSRMVNLVTTGSGGALTTNYSDKARAYYARAAQLDMMAKVRGGGLPYAGGISLADKQTQMADPDRTPPQFSLGFEDDTIPVGSADSTLREDVPVQ